MVLSSFSILGDWFQDTSFFHRYQILNPLCKIALYLGTFPLSAGGYLATSAATEDLLPDCSLLQQPQEPQNVFRKIHSSFSLGIPLIDITSVSTKHSQVVMESLSSLLDLGITLVYFSQPVTIHPLNKHCPLDTPQCTKTRPMF